MTAHVQLSKVAVLGSLPSKKKSDRARTCASFVAHMMATSLPPAPCAFRTASAASASLYPCSNPA